MNKELINKYKPEFDHWLNGGTICVKPVNNLWLTFPDGMLDINWSNEDEDEDVIIVINDRYVEFRKALAEGKTVEANVNYWAHPPTNELNWQECPEDSFHKYNVANLRIKPIEFKFGDYVKLTSTTHIALKTYPSWFQIDGKDVTLHGSYINIEKGQHIFHFNELELWQPKPNEWCWFWDRSADKFANISRFKELYKDKFKSVNCTWNYCAPFIGELPPHLKD